MAGLTILNCVLTGSSVNVRVPQRASVGDCGSSLGFRSQERCISDVPELVECAVRQAKTFG